MDTTTVPHGTSGPTPSPEGSPPRVPLIGSALYCRPKTVAALDPLLRLQRIITHLRTPGPNNKFPDSITFKTHTSPQGFFQLLRS